eukprot:10375743-Alexandrium_andersonii.AAC.1
MHELQLLAGLPGAAVPRARVADAWQLVLVAEDDQGRHALRNVEQLEDALELRGVEEGDFVNDHHVVHGHQGQRLVDRL